MESEIKAGDKVCFSLDRDYPTYPKDENTLVIGTCIQTTDLYGYLIAWTKDEDKYIFSYELEKDNDTIESSTFSNFPNHIFGYWIAQGDLKLFKEKILSCKKCQVFNEYATANQSDGSFICYSCRS